MSDDPRWCEEVFHALQHWIDFEDGLFPCDLEIRNCAEYLVRHGYRVSDVLSQLSEREAPCAIGLGLKYARKSLPALLRDGIRSNQAKCWYRR